MRYSSGTDPNLDIVNLFAYRLSKRSHPTMNQILKACLIDMAEADQPSGMERMGKEGFWIKSVLMVSILTLFKKQPTNPPLDTDKQISLTSPPRPPSSATTLHFTISCGEQCSFPSATHHEISQVLTEASVILPPLHSCMLHLPTSQRNGSQQGVPIQYLHCGCSVYCALQCIRLPSAMHECLRQSSDLWDYETGEFAT